MLLAVETVTATVTIRETFEPTIVTSATEVTLFDGALVDEDFTINEQDTYVLMYPTAWQVSI